MLALPNPSMLNRFIALAVLLAGSTVAQAAEGHGVTTLDLTGSMVGIISLLVFVLAYLVVMGEEFLHLRKSKPVLISAGIIWTLIGIAYARAGDHHTAEAMVRGNLLEYGELMLFLLAAMTYVNTMQERLVFERIRAWLVSSGFSLRSVFWITGLLAFFISPVADNLTTALLMAAVVMAVAPDNRKFVVVACINIVIAANAGGAFSPFGDITTLMVWQKGVVEFHEFFDIFVPSAVNWLVPAAFMSLSLANEHPKPLDAHVAIKPGGLVIVGLFFLTIAAAVCMHNFLYLPPVLGMMLGLGVLKSYGFVLRRRELRGHNGDAEADNMPLEMDAREIGADYKPRNKPFDIFVSVKRAEWDTLLFFYGVILSVGGLGTIGYLALLSEHSYVTLGPTWANVGVGVISAIVDNIPVMFAVLTMMPDMSHGQWLLVTLTAGVGGSLLSIGSAAGVALMGQARGTYTFFAHLKWTWAIALGYAASIWVHLWFNADLMHVPVDPAAVHELGSADRLTPLPTTLPRLGMAPASTAEAG